ncbi:BTB/POZ domain [Trinorchestia longiramus]|nr:BTB/POZ domain [Trinorchestia longiramus]
MDLSSNNDEACLNDRKESMFFSNANSSDDMADDATNIVSALTACSTNTEECVALSKVDSTNLSAVDKFQSCHVQVSYGDKNHQRPVSLKPKQSYLLDVLMRERMERKKFGRRRRVVVKKSRCRPRRRRRRCRPLFCSDQDSEVPLEIAVAEELVGGEKDNLAESAEQCDDGETEAEDEGFGLSMPPHEVHRDYLRLGLSYFTAMPPVEIQWCDHSTVLLEYLRQLYDDGRFVDVGLECEGRQVKAHKAVISACSPYLEGLLKGNPARSHLIKFNGYSYNSLRAVIDFMYNGKVMVEQDHLAAFLKLGRALQVRGILDIAAQCEEAGLTTAEETKSNAQYSTTVQSQKQQQQQQQQQQQAAAGGMKTQSAAETKKYAFMLDKAKKQPQQVVRKPGQFLV